MFLLLLGFIALGIGLTIFVNPILGFAVVLLSLIPAVKLINEVYRK